MSNGSRRALCIGVSSFTPAGAADEDEPDLVLFGNLDYAVEYTAGLATALRTAGYDVDLVVDSGVLKARDLGERVEDHLSDDGVAIVHVLSHGQYTAGGGVYVVGSDATQSKETRVEEWRISVNDGKSTPTTLFLLDFCHAGAANRLWQPPAAGSQEKAWVIAATGAAEPAYGGRLTRAAASVIRSITAGEVDLAETVRTVTFGVLFERIRQEIHALVAQEGGRMQDPTATPVEAGVLPELPFFDNPHFDPNPITEVSGTVAAAAAPFLDPILDADHFRGRAAGYAHDADGIAVGCFTGRAPQLSQLSDWMDGDGSAGLVVVTGSPGAGKSALLGVLVCAAHPVLRAATQDLWRAAAAAPSENPDLAAVHARQRTMPAILRSLTEQLGLEIDDHGGELTGDVVVDAIARRANPPVIVIDAVDEAPDHERLVAQLLVPLARARRADGPACRLLVGMRPWPELAPLLDLASDIGEVIDLDRIPAEQRRRDVADYINRLLELLPGYRTAAHRAGRHGFAEGVAGALVPDPGPPAASGDDHDRHDDRSGQPRWGEFLVAALYTHTVSLGSPDQLADRDASARLGADAPRTLPDILELDLAARRPLAWRRPLLTALASARGAGIPRSVLPALVAALADDPVPATEEEIAAELDALRFYLRTSADTDASALYRLFHQGLADYLRDERAGDDMGVADRLLDGLLTAVPQPRETRWWGAAVPYLLRHAVQYAASVGRVDELLTDPGFLIHADPATLIPALHLASAEPARLAAAVYRTSTAGHPQASPAQRRDVLAVDSARYRASALLHGLASAPGTSRPGWWPRWATGGQVGTTALRATLAGHAYRVPGVACTRLGDRPVAVTAGWDRTVRVWDLITGTQVGDPLTGHPGTVFAVACTQLDGQPVAVSGGSSSGSNDNAVRVWDLSSGTQISNLLTGHGSGVLAVACTQLDGRPVAVVAGGRECTVQVWDLITGTQAGDPLTGHTDRVEAVACTLLDGRPVAVTGGRDRTVRIWDLGRRTQIGALPTGPAGNVEATAYTAPDAGAVYAVACTQLDGRPVAITGGADATARMWDLGRRTQIGALPTGPASAVLALACTELDGRPVAITARGAAIRVWDLGRRTQIGGPLTGPDTVLAVACTQLNGQPVAITGSLDETVRVWNLAPGAAIGDPLTGHTEMVTALACTQLDGGWVAITGDTGGSVRFWDLSTGTAIGQPIPGHTDKVSAIACTELTGRPVAVTRGWDHKLQVWDLGRRTRIGGAPGGYPQRVRTLACAQLDGEPVTVAAVGKSEMDVTLRVRRLSDGVMIGKPLTGHTGMVEAVACTQREGRPIAVTAGGDSTVRVWDLATGTPLGNPLTGHEHEVEGVACTQLDGQPVAVTAGGRDCTVRVWDLITGTQIGHPLIGHTGWVETVACTQLDGQPVAVTAGRDRTVRIWDIGTRSQVDRFNLPTPASAIDVTSSGDIVAAIGWDIVHLERTTDRPL